MEGGPGAVAVDRPGRGELADDELGRLHDREDLALGARSLERLRGAVDVIDVADPAGVTSLDRQDRARGGEDLLRPDVADLTQVRGDAGVLERLRGGLELGLVGGRTPEVELRPLDRGMTQSALQEAHVCDLVRLDDARELPELAAELALGDSLAVERRLQVLERQREVENRDVALRDTGTGDRRQSAEERDRACDGSGADAGLLQERCARVAVDVLGVLTDRAVQIQLFQRGKKRHRAPLETASVRPAAE